jgi:hypothetical protein
MMFILERAFQNGVACTIPRLVARVLFILLNTMQLVKLLKSQLRAFDGFDRMFANSVLGRYR